MTSGLEERGCAESLLTADVKAGFAFFSGVSLAYVVCLFSLKRETNRPPRACAILRLCGVRALGNLFPSSQIHLI